MKNQLTQITTNTLQLPSHDGQNKPGDVEFASQLISPRDTFYILISHASVFSMLH